MYEQPSYKTPRRTKLLILGAAFAGLVLQVAQFVFFVVVTPWGDFPGPFDWWDKIEVTYENPRDETVYVYLDDQLEATIPPNSTVTQSDLKFLWWFGRRVEVRHFGVPFFAAKYDDDDLRRMGYRIVIPDS